MQPPGSQQGQSRLDDLSISEVHALIYILSLDLRQVCDHCKYWGCPHGEKCKQYYIRHLTSRLRHHKSLTWQVTSKSDASESSPLTTEMCATHHGLNQGLMSDILLISVEAEDVLTTAVERIAQTSDKILTHEITLDMLAPLKVVAEASLMWTGKCRTSRSTNWKQKYPGLMRRGQWSTQQSHCTACILEGTLKSTDLLGMTLLSLWLRGDWTEQMVEAQNSIDKAMDWLRQCLKVAAPQKTTDTVTQAARLYGWIKGHLGQPPVYIQDGQWSTTTRTGEFAKLVLRLQEREFARLLDTPRTEDQARHNVDHTTDKISDDRSDGVSSVTLFPDDDEVDGKLATRQLGNLHDFSTTSDGAEIAKEIQTHSPIQSGSGQSIASFYNWVNGSKSATVPRGDRNVHLPDCTTRSSLALSSYHSTPLHLPADLDFTGIEALGQRIDSFLDELMQDNVTGARDLRYG